MMPRSSICSCENVQSGAITGFNIGIFYGLEFFQGSQTIVQTYGIALTMCATVNKIIYKKRIILEHDAALKGVTDLKSGVSCIYCFEGPASHIFYNAHAIRKPAYPYTVAWDKVFHLYRCAVGNDVRLSERLFMKGDAEGIPMFATHIAAQNIQCAGKDGVIAGNLTPETAQGVFCYMLVGDSFDFNRQQVKIRSALDRMSEALFHGLPER